MAVADLVAEVMRQGSCLVLVGMVVREVQTARMGNRRQIQILYSEHEADPEHHSPNFNFVELLCPRD